MQKPLIIFRKHATIILNHTKRSFIMRNFPKILSLFLVLLLLCSALISCGEDGGTENPAAPSEKHITVTLKDGITGDVITTAEINSGADYIYTEADLNAKYYGYTFNEEKFNKDRKALTEDTTITAEFLPSEVMTVALLDISGNPIHTVEKDGNGNMLTSDGAITDDPSKAKPLYPFVLRATEEEIRAGKEQGALIFKSDVSVYCGGSIYTEDFAEFIPDEIARAFSHWSLDGEAYGGGKVTESIEIRARYTATDLALYNNASSSFSSISISKVRDGNDIIPENPTKETVTDIFGERCTATAGAFRYIDTMPEDLIYYGSGETGRIKLSDGTPFDPSSYVNKFSGVSASKYYSKGRVAIDYEQYAGFEDGVLNILIAVRDETPYYLTGSYSNGNGDVDYDMTPYWNDGSITWDAVDMVECRYYIPAGESAEAECTKGPCGYGGMQYNQDNTKDFSKPGIRVAKISREGELSFFDELGYKVSEGNIVKMNDYFEVADLAPEDNTRKTLMLTDSRGNDNGYAIGIKIRVQDYLDAIGRGDWTKKTVLFTPELEDRYSDCRDLSELVKNLNGKSLSEKLKSMSASELMALPKTDWHTAYNFAYDDDNNPGTPAKTARNGANLFCVGINNDYKLEHFKAVTLVNKSED